MIASNLSARELANEAVRSYIGCFCAQENLTVAFSIHGKVFVQLRPYEEYTALNNFYVIAHYLNFTDSINIYRSLKNV